MKWVAEHHGWSSSRRVACGDEYPWKALVALCRWMQARGDGGQGEAVPAAWRALGNTGEQERSVSGLLSL